MRKTILTLLLFVCQLMAFADNSALLITLKDGSKAGYILSQKPSVTFGESTLSITVADAATEYNIQDVNTFTFVDAEEVAAIQKLTDGSTLFEYRNGVVRSNGTIQVYTLDGKLLQQGTSTLSLNGQPSGMYIVKTNNKAIKVKK